MIKEVISIRRKTFPEWIVARISFPYLRKLIHALGHSSVCKSTTTSPFDVSIRTLIFALICFYDNGIVMDGWMDGWVCSVNRDSICICMFER